MEKLPKWIIEDDTLIIGKCYFHKDLANDIDNVKGGGWFYFDGAKDGICLYGTSDQFGSTNLEQVKKCLESGKVGRFIGDNRYSNFKIYFTEGNEKSNYKLV